MSGDGPEKWKLRAIKVRAMLVKGLEIWRNIFIPKS